MTLLWVMTMRNARSTCCYQVQRCLMTTEVVHHPPRIDRCNEFKKWMKPLQEFTSSINSKKCEATAIAPRHILQNSRKFKMLGLRTHKGQFFLDSKSVKIFEKAVQFPRIITKKIFKNDIVDLHPNTCLRQPLRNYLTFTGTCSNKMKYSMRFPLTSSDAQLGYDHVATVRHFSTSSSTVETPPSNIFYEMDKAFTKICSNDQLISLLNSIVSPEDQVRNIQDSDSYKSKKFRNSIGIEATDNRGERYNVEIQIIDDFEYQKKPLDHWSGHFSEQLRKTIRIHILGFTYLPEIESYHNTFVVNEKDGQIELHTIELEKFHDNDKEGLQELVKKIKTPLDKWLAFFTAGVLLDKDNLPEVLNDEHIQTALDYLYRYYFQWFQYLFDPRERIAVKDYLKSLRDEWGKEGTRKRLGNIESYKLFAPYLLDAEQMSEELEQMRVDLVRVMLKHNEPIDEIAKVSHLSQEEIISLKNGETIKLTISNLEYSLPVSYKL